LSGSPQIAESTRSRAPRTRRSGSATISSGSRIAKSSSRGSRHWAIFRRLCLDTGTGGRHVTNAWFAALAIEWGCEWVTLDRDFARFPGLRWAAPGKP